MSVEYSVLQPSDTAEMVDVLSEAFVDRDPPTLAVDLTVDEFRDFVRALGPTAETDELTIVARDASDGSLLGALLAEDCASEEPDELAHISPKFGAIFGILDELASDYWDERQPDRGDAVHIFLIGVSAEAAGQGIAQGLVSACLENARRKGYSRAVTEATGRVSQHVFRKLGFNQKGQIAYDSFQFDNEAVFQSVADQGGPMIMDTSIQT